MRLAEASYGMPDIGAVYRERGGRGWHERAKGARCPICGAIADPRACTGKGDVRVLETRVGAFVLEPPWFAVCRRCWPKVEEAAWVWDRDDVRGRWESGILLSHGMAPHSPDLGRCGHWELALAGGGSLCPVPRGCR